MGSIIIQTTLLYIKYSKETACILSIALPYDLIKKERKSKNFPPNPLNNVASELTKIYIWLLLRHLGT